MRLEVLITKYLDGELTSGEDRELRQLLSRNPDAKSTFDLSISLHHALRKDAVQISPPSQLVRETEDRILMAILNQPEPQPDKKKEKRLLSLFSTGSRVLTGLVAVLIPLFTSSIGFEVPPTTTRHTNHLAGIGGEQVQAQSANNQPLNRDRLSGVHNRSTARVDSRRTNAVAWNSRISRQQEIAQIPPSNSQLPIHSIVSEEQAGNSYSNQIESGVAPASMNRDFNSSGEIPLAAAMTSGAGYPSRFSTISASLPASAFSGAMFGGMAFGDKVNLSTTFGHDVLDIASGDPLGLSFISQSLAYSLGESENAGIEVGYLWFTYARPVQKFIPNTSNANGWDGNSDPYGYDSKPYAMKVQGENADIQGQSDVSPLPDHPNGEYITDLQLFPKQTWWGAAFYERTFTHNERISLQGRIGAGGSNDGALAYVRATGLYRLLDNLSLSVGVDARGMMLRTPYVTPKSSTVKTSLSIIYGLQLHL